MDKLFHYDRLEPCVRLITAHGSGKPRGQHGWVKRIGAVAVEPGVVSLAIGVYETGLVIVRQSAVPRRDRVLGDRFAGGSQPLFPFSG